jgi:hypothetical protein
MALIAMLLGILFLYLNMKRYDNKLKPGVAAATARASSDPAWTPGLNILS